MTPELRAEIQEVVRTTIAELGRRGSPVTHEIFPPVMGLQHAMIFVDKPSEHAFDRWKKKWNVRPCSHGRYSRGELERAMKRESMKTYQKPGTVAA